MKRYKVVVNGTEYQVDVEELRSQTVQKQEAQSAGQQEQQTDSETEAKNQKEKTAGSILVTAPMPGTILDVKVTEGQDIAAGATLLVMEAMKMENEIVAPQDGTIASVSTARGVSVNAGDILVIIN